MAFRVFGEWFATADFVSTPRIYQPVTFPAKTSLRALRTWVVFYNSPAFSSLEMRVYSDVNGSLGDLISTGTNGLTLSEMTSEAYAAREIYFEFSQAIPIPATQKLNFAIWANGYTGTGSSHISWVKALPDPVNTSGLTITPTKLVELPFKIGLIGALL